MHIKISSIKPHSIEFLRIALEQQHKLIQKNEEKKDEEKANAATTRMEKE